MYSLSNETNNIQTQFGNQQMDIYTQLQIVFQKISKLEDSQNNLAQLLNDEISQRQILEKHSTTSIDAFSGQLNILKNNYDKIEEIFVENLSKMNTEAKPKKNENETDELIKNEFAQFKNELSKIDNLENKINLINKENKKNVKEINEKIENVIINEIKPIKDTQKKNKNNYQKLKEEFQINVNNNQNYLNEVNNILLDFKKNMDTYNSSYNKFSADLKKLHQSVLTDKENNNMKIKELDEEMGVFFTEKSREYENFENHLLGEYEKFINFIKDKVEEYNEGMKKLVNYNGEDINLIKEKINLFQEDNNKMRIDIFKGLNESQDFFEKKYNSILSLINK